jgi:sulfur-oxidizing protein SoxZ
VVVAADGCTFEGINMGKPIKIRAKVKGDVTEVKALMPHPMETGVRIDADTGEAVPRHYIQQVVCKLNGNVINTFYWGTGVSKNPYLSFKIRDASPGDRLEISWLDNTGDTSATEIEL